jgi:hypothetical protein
VQLIVYDLRCVTYRMQRGLGQAFTIQTVNNRKQICMLKIASEPPIMEEYYSLPELYAPKYSQMEDMDDGLICLSAAEKLQCDFSSLREGAPRSVNTHSVPEKPNL